MTARLDHYVLRRLRSSSFGNPYLRVSDDGFIRPKFVNSQRLRESPQCSGVVWTAGEPGVALKLGGACPNCWALEEFEHSVWQTGVRLLKCRECHHCWKVDAGRDDMKPLSESRWYFAGLESEYNQVRVAAKFARILAGEYPAGLL